jgi:GntR family transcriptional regulator of vanillate catabolism
VSRRHDDHHRIHEAIIAGEPWRAEWLMREHVSSVKGSLIRAAARNGDQADEPST